MGEEDIIREKGHYKCRMIESDICYAPFLVRLVPRPAHEGGRMRTPAVAPGARDRELQADLFLRCVRRVARRPGIPPRLVRTRRRSRRLEEPSRLGRTWPGRPEPDPMPAGRSGGATSVGGPERSPIRTGRARTAPTPAGPTGPVADGGGTGHLLAASPLCALRNQFSDRA